MGSVRFALDTNGSFQNEERPGLFVGRRPGQRPCSLDSELRAPHTLAATPYTGTNATVAGGHASDSDVHRRPVAPRLDSNGRTIWIVDAHGYGKRFIVHADEILTAFVELEAAIWGASVEPSFYETGLSNPICAARQPRRAKHNQERKSLAAVSFSGLLDGQAL